jgi:hypothetical protein
VHPSLLYRGIHLVAFGELCLSAGVAGCVLACLAARGWRAMRGRKVVAIED